MYCTSCGMQAAGRFCADCGTRIQAPGLGAVEPAGDWRGEVRYAVLLHMPEVLNRLAAVQQGRKRVSAEEWLELGEKLFDPLGGVSVKTMAAIVTPLYARLGINTGKAQTETLAVPPGQVIVAALCALARQGLPLTKVHQGDAGCVLEARLPSDLWSFEGQVVVAVERAGAITKVKAATKVPGQLYDWGKSKRCLDALFAELRRDAETDLRTL